LVEGYATYAERRARYLITGLRNMLDMPESGTTGERPALDPDKIHQGVKDPRVADEAATQLMGADANGAPAAEPRKSLSALLGADTSLATALFSHPLIQSLQTRKVRPRSNGAVRNPQYIPSSVFARALISTLLFAGANSRPRTSQPDAAAATPALPTAGQVLETLRGVVDGLPPAMAARRSLLALIDQAEGRLETLQESIEDWFDAEMGRVSGWYKRWAQAVLLVVGFVVAILANVDTVSVTHTLWVNAPVRSAVVAEAASGALCGQVTDVQQRQTCAEAEIGQLASAGVPIGPAPGCGSSDLEACFASSIQVHNRLGAFLLKLLGWLLTAVAISFGAPFWFDALSKLGNLRSAGPKPQAGSG
jgi:hypothetical protein